MWRPGRGSSMWRSSLTRSVATSCAGRPRGRYPPTWPWTRWSWPSGAARPSWTAWSITPIGAAIPVRPLHPAPRRRRRGHLGRLPRRLVRGCAGRDDLGLDKTELIRRRGPWKGLDEVEYATLEWVDWFNHRRLLEPSAISHQPSSRPPLPKGGSQPHRRTQAPKPPMNPGRFTHVCVLSDDTAAHTGHSGRDAGYSGGASERPL